MYIFVQWMHASCVLLVGNEAVTSFSMIINCTARTASNLFVHTSPYRNRQKLCTSARDMKGFQEQMGTEENKKTWDTESVWVLQPKTTSRADGILQQWWKKASDGEANGPDSSSKPIPHLACCINRCSSRGSSITQRRGPAAPFEFYLSVWANRRMSVQLHQKSYLYEGRSLSDRHRLACSLAASSIAHLDTHTSE